MESRMQVKRADQRPGQDGGTLFAAAPQVAPDGLS